MLATTDYEELQLQTNTQPAPLGKGAHCLLDATGVLVSARQALELHDALKVKAEEDKKKKHKSAILKKNFFLCVFVSILFARIQKLCIRDNGPTIVHEHHELAEDGERLGFTSFFLLDESHSSLHVGADGRMVMDVFTCGTTDPRKIMASFQQHLLRVCPDTHTVRSRYVPRFLFVSRSKNEGKKIRRR